MPLIRKEDFESMTLLDWILPIRIMAIIAAVVLLLPGCLVSLPPIPTSAVL